MAIGFLGPLISAAIALSFSTQALAGLDYNPDDPNLIRKRDGAMNYDQQHPIEKTEPLDVPQVPTDKAEPTPDSPKKEPDKDKTSQ